MAKVRFTNIQAQKALDSQVKARVLADLTPAGRGQSRQLNNAYEAHIKRVSERLLTTGVKRIDEVAKEEYRKAIREVKRILNSGVGISKGNPVEGGKPWSAFNRRYFLRKLRENSATANLFWRGSGDLASAYDRFSKQYIKQINASTQSVQVVSVGKKFVNRRFRFRVDFKYPSPEVGGNFFDTIFTQSFFQSTAFDITGQTTGDGDLDKIGYLEGLGESTRHRPFISQLMANRGKGFQTRLTRILKSQTT